MRSLSSAVALLVLCALRATATDCPIPVRVANDMVLIPLHNSSPSCRSARDLQPDFDKLVAAAGFRPGDLTLWIDSAGQEVNAVYLPGKVLLTTAFLKDEVRGRDARVMAIAHEIAHAIQDRDKLIEWRGRPGDEGFLARSRRIEAHADAIGQELMVRAGYAADAFTSGTGDYFGCQSRQLREDSATHPTPAQRFVNNSIIAGTEANSRARAALARHAREFGEASAQAPEPPVQPFTPSARITDFNDQGQLMPGRRVVESLGLGQNRPPPSPGAAPSNIVAAGAAALWTSALNRFFVTPFSTAVDQLSSDPSFINRVFAVCGAPGAAELNENFSVMGWIKAIAANASRRAAANNAADGVPSEPL